MTFNCPSCNAPLEADMKPGDLADCPNCGQTIQVPSAVSFQRPIAQQTPAARAAAIQRMMHGPKIPWFGAIMALLFVFPIGIFAVVFAALSSGAWKAGEAAKAEGYATVCRILTAIGGCILLVVLLFMLAGAWSR